jgi:hypothetical protein
MASENAPPLSTRCRVRVHWLLGALGTLFLLTYPAIAQERMKIDFHGKAPLGLVGNGASIVKVRPSGFEFFEGGNASGRFRLIVDGKPHEVRADDECSSFFPGGVSYRLAINGMEVEILHGATSELPYTRRTSMGS